MGNEVERSAAHADPRRTLPSVSALLEDPQIHSLIVEHSRPLVLDAIHEALDWFRANLKPGDATPAMSEVVGKVQSFLQQAELPRLRPVVNATGIILHTGLGRAVLPKQAVQALAQLDRCCNVQIDLETGLRGKRNSMTQQLLTRLTGAEAAMITNNNAAATFLILAALCHGKEVIISRGQLIEIGGSFRLPDCIRQSGAVMVEVGTTNKTHLRDYENAITENTGAILRCNPSNYRIIGFTHDVPIADLVSLKQKHPSLIVIDDLGCGVLIDLSQYGLPKEPTIQESIAAGADLICSSGDKLIGGPQAGIIVGRKTLIDQIRKHPLTRMLRVCKLTDIALEHTLRLFLDPDTLAENLPTLRMISAPADVLKRKAARLKRKIDRKRLPLTVRVAESESATGGGSLPAISLKTYVLALSSPHLSVDRLSYLLRTNEPPIIPRIKDDEVHLDMRTLLEGEENLIADALQRIAHFDKEVEGSKLKVPS